MGPADLVPRQYVEIRQFGRVPVLQRAQLEAFTCTCGDPACTGDQVMLTSECDHGNLVMYDKATGLLVMWCPQCGRANAVRIAGDA